MLSSVNAPPVVNLVVPPETGVALSPVLTTDPNPKFALAADAVVAPVPPWAISTVATSSLLFKYLSTLIRLDLSTNFCHNLIIFMVVVH